MKKKKFHKFSYEGLIIEAKVDRNNPNPKV